MIEVKLDFMLLERKMSSKELAEKVGITPANLSILKTGKAHGVRFDTLSKICEVLNCQPGELLVYKKNNGGVKNDARQEKANKVSNWNTTFDFILCFYEFNSR